MDGIFETISNLRDLLEPDCTSNDSGGRIIKRALKEGIANALTMVENDCNDEEIKQETSALNGQVSKFLQTSTGRSS
jgi:hypothetical protein